MSKITIDVSSKNLETVLLILESLKDGLVLNIEVDNSRSKYTAAYKPKIHKAVFDNEQAAESSNGKYLSAASFKKRLQK